MAHYWVGGNANWDATAGTKWATSSGGAGGAAVPTSADDVFLDNGTGTGNVTLASGYAANAKTIDCTGYVGTLSSADATGSLTVAGSVTFVAGMTLSCTNSLVVNTTATLTSGGLTWGGNMTLSGATTKTMAGGSNWTVSGSLTLSTTSNALNSTTTEKMICNGLVISNNTTGTGTIEIASGTWSGSGTTTNSIIFNGGAITFSYTGTFGGVLTYTAGTITVTGSTLTLGNSTVATNGMTWNDVALTGTSTTTLTNNFACSGNFTAGNAAAKTINGVGLTFTVGGSFTTGSMTSQQFSGTATIILNGTGTLQTPSMGTGNIQNDLTISSANITLTGNVNYRTGTLTLNNSFLGTGTLEVPASFTLAGGGNTIPNILFTSTATVTLNSNVTVGLLTVSSGTATWNSNTLTITNGITLSATFTALNGTTTVDLTGGTWQAAATSNVVNANLNLAGTITISGTVAYGTRTLTYVSGTLTTSGSTILIASNCTLTSNSQSFNNLTIATGAIQLTLGSDLTLLGSLVSLATNGACQLNGFVCYVAGSISGASMSGIGTFGGTTDVVMNGTGSISMGAVTTGGIIFDLEINTAGTITISGTVTYRTGNLKYTAGTMAGVSTPILVFNNTTTWTNNATFTATFLTVAPTASLTLNGTNGFLIGTFSCTTTGLTHTFAATETYTVNTNLTLTGTAASDINMVSGTGGSQAIFTLVPGATQSVSYVETTDIDSSLGQTIWVYKPTALNNTLNWRTLGPTLPTMGFAYVQ